MNLWPSHPESGGLVWRVVRMPQRRLPTLCGTVPTRDAKPQMQFSKPRNSVELFPPQLTQKSPANVCTEPFIQDLAAYPVPAFHSLYRQVEDVVQELLAKS
jgi:hypothetical protein